jgi:hypothetical protein
MIRPERVPRGSFGGYSGSATSAGSSGWVPLRDTLEFALLPLALGGLLVGVVLTMSGSPAVAGAVWTAGVVPVLASPLIEIRENVSEAKSASTLSQRFR